jgi:hypothetical protein
MSGYEYMSQDQLEEELKSIQSMNDYLKKENELYDNYISRILKKNSAKADLLENEEDTKEIEKKQKPRKRNQQQVQEVKVLSLAEKHEIASSELEELKSSITEGQKKSEELLEWLKAVLDEIDINIAEIKREAHEFKRDIVLGSENSRTGKIIAEKLIKYIEERIRLKDTIIQKNEENNEKLKKSINKEKLKIQKKEQANDDLQFIDFHQLQIENKKLVRDIDDKNKQLLSLKVNAGTNTQNLTHTKDELNHEEKELKSLTEQIEESTKNIEINEKMIAKVKKMTLAIERKNRKFKIQKYESDNLPSVSDYIDLKNQEASLLKKLSTLERKIQIAQPSYENGLKILTKT